MDNVRIANELTRIAKELVAVKGEPVFDYDAAKALAGQMKTKIKAPFVSATVGTLGGKERPHIIVKISLDPKSEWTNGIYQNSRYGIFSLDHFGSLELYSKYYELPKMRKSRAKDGKTAIDKINKYIALAKSERL